MKAQEWKGGSPSGWWWSEKLNGIRSYWDGAQMWTLNGNPIDLPVWFASDLPPVALDGELWFGRGKDALQQMVSIKSDVRDPRWKKVRYAVFDAPETTGACEKRWAVAKQAIRGSKVAIYVEQAACTSEAALERMFQAVLKKGGEGLMGRRKGSAYERKRSTNLRKKKPLSDAEAVITGYEQGKAGKKYEGMLGAYLVHFVKKPSIKFKVGTGLTDRDRANPLPKGTIITVQWKNETPNGKPHPASFVGVRDYDGPPRKRSSRKARRNGGWQRHATWVKPGNTPSPEFMEAQYSAGFIAPDGQLYDTASKGSGHVEFAEAWLQGQEKDIEEGMDPAYQLVLSGWVKVSYPGEYQFKQTTEDAKNTMAWVSALRVLDEVFPDDALEDIHLLWGVGGKQDLPAIEVVEKYGTPELSRKFWETMGKGGRKMARANSSRRVRPYNWTVHDIYKLPHARKNTALDYFPAETDDGFIMPTNRLSARFFGVSMSAGLIDPAGNVYDLTDPQGQDKLSHEDFAELWYESNYKELEEEYEMDFHEHPFTDALIAEHGWLRIGEWKAFELPPAPTRAQLNSLAWVVAQGVLRRPNVRMESHVYLGNSTKPAIEVVERMGKPGLVDDMFSNIDRGNESFARRNRGKRRARRTKRR